jgi:hypothetical protein
MKVKFNMYSEPWTSLWKLNWKIKAKSDEVILDTAKLTEQTKLSGYVGLQPRL